jgi:hypothetical protein
MYEYTLSSDFELGSHLMFMVILMKQNLGSRNVAYVQKTLMQ